MQTDNEKIVQVRATTRQLSSQTDSTILDLTITLMPNNPCRFDLNIVTDAQKSLSRDMRFKLEKQQTMELREELAEGGFIMITASTDPNGYGGNTLFLTATKKQSRLAVKGNYTSEADGFLFQTTVNHLFLEQPGWVTLHLTGKQALLCQMALENYVNHAAELFELAGYGIDESAQSDLQETAEDIAQKVNALPKAEEELRAFAKLLLLQREPAESDGSQTGKTLLRLLKNQPPEENQ